MYWSIRRRNLRRCCLRAERRALGGERESLTPSELRTLRRLTTPAKIQKFLEELPYHHAPTAWSPRRVLREGTAHCLEGALLAAAALRVQGFPALLMDLEAVQDTDHVLSIFRQRGRWGAVAKSNYAGLRYREPVYRSLRELAMSYFDSYYNYRGERTLRAHSGAVRLARFDRLQWMTSEADLWAIPEHLAEVKHYPLLTPKMVRALTRLDRRNFDAGQVGAVIHHKR